jgi:hypothetical protein
VIAVLVALLVVAVVWFVFAIPGCGSGSSGLGRG